MTGGRKQENLARGVRIVVSSNPDLDENGFAARFLRATAIVAGSGKGAVVHETPLEEGATLVTVEPLPNDKKKA